MEQIEMAIHIDTKRNKEIILIEKHSNIKKFLQTGKLPVEQIYYAEREIGDLLRNANSGIPSLKYIEDVENNKPILPILDYDEETDHFYKDLVGIRPYNRRYFLEETQPDFDDWSDSPLARTVRDDMGIEYGNFKFHFYSSLENGTFMPYQETSFDKKYIELNKDTYIDYFDLYCGTQNPYFRFYFLKTKELYFELVNIIKRNLEKNKLPIPKEIVLRIKEYLTNSNGNHLRKQISEAMPTNHLTTLDCWFFMANAYHLADTKFDLVDSHLLNIYQQLCPYNFNYTSDISELSGIYEEKDYLGRDFYIVQSYPVYGLIAYERKLREENLYIRLCDNCKSAVITNKNTYPFACKRVEKVFNTSTNQYEDVFVCRRRKATELKKSYDAIKKIHVPGEKERQAFYNSIYRKRERSSVKYDSDVTELYDRLVVECQEYKNKITDDSNYSLDDYTQWLKEQRKYFFAFIKSKESNS